MSEPERRTTFTADEFCRVAQFEQLDALTNPKVRAVVDAALRISAVCAKMFETRKEMAENMEISVTDDPWLNLEGAIIDIEANGFDDVCLRTIKRVRDQMAAIRSALIQDKQDV